MKTVFVTIRHNMDGDESELISVCKTLKSAKQDSNDNARGEYDNPKIKLQFEQFDNYFVAGIPYWRGGSPDISYIYEIREKQIRP